MSIRQLQPVGAVTAMKGPPQPSVSVYAWWGKVSWGLCLVTLISVCVSINGAPTTATSLTTSTPRPSKGQQDIATAIVSAVSHRAGSPPSSPSQPGTGVILHPKKHEDNTDTALEFSVQTKETQPEIASQEPGVPETQIKGDPFDFWSREENSTTFEKVLVPDSAVEDSATHDTTDGKLPTEKSVKPTYVTTGSDNTKDKALRANVRTTVKEDIDEALVEDGLVANDTKIIKDNAMSGSPAVPADDVENQPLTTNVTSERNSTLDGPYLSGSSLDTDRGESGPVEDVGEGPIEEDPSDSWGNFTERNESVSEKVLRWNIQNDTTYNRTSLFDDLDPETARRVTIGKVCIMLNGTVVKDMEEADCRSQAGLHYKYIPARFRTNATALNTTTHVYNTEAYDEGHREAATEESPLNNGDEDGDTEGDTDEMNKSRPPESRAPNIDPDGNTTTSQDARDWEARTASETVSNPFEPAMNGSDLMKVASDGSTESERESEPLRELTKGKKASVNRSSLQESSSKPLKVSGQMPTESSSLFKASNVSSAAPDVPHGKGDSHSLSFLTIDSGGSSNSSRQGNGSGHAHIYSPKAHHNGSHRGTANIGGAPGRQQTLPREGHARTGPKSPNDHISSAGLALNDSKVSRLNNQTSERNGSTGFVKERRKSARYPSRQSPKIVITYQNGYVPHAIHGLIWEDRHYMFSVLIPIGCGMAGALLIVCIAYLARNYNSQPALKAKRIMET